MQRVNAPGATVSNMFTNGDVALGIPATELEQTWHNDVQEEICNVIEGLGGTLNGSLRNQLLTVLSTNYAKIPAGTRMVFYQAAAPAGWTQIVTQNDKALRVVSAAGGGAGGTHGLSSPPSLAHTHTGPNHAHDMSLHTHSQPSHAHDMSLHTHSQPTHTHTYSTVISHSHTFTGDALSAHSHLEYYSGADGSSQGSNISGTNTTSGAPGYSANATQAVSAGTPTGTISTTGSASGTTGASGGDATGTPSNNTTGASGGDTTGTPSNNTTGASGTGNTGSATPTSFAPLYIDVIICQRD